MVLFGANTYLVSQTPILLINQSAKCSLSIDGEEVGTIEAEGTLKVRMTQGDHLVECELKSWIMKYRGFVPRLSTTVHVVGTDQRIVKLPFLTVTARSVAGDKSSGRDPVEVSIGQGATIRDPNSCNGLEVLEEETRVEVTDGGRTTNCDGRLHVSAEWRDTNGLHRGLVAIDAVEIGPGGKVKLTP